MTLSSAAVGKIFEAVSTCGLMRLSKEYHARNIEDGTQWILWIKQGENEKAVYFNNDFPEAITRFAETVDNVLLESGSVQVQWERFPDVEHHQHEKDLWSRIK